MDERIDRTASREPVSHDEVSDAPLPAAEPPVDIRSFSVKCGACGEYQTVVGFRALDAEWNEYAYECESPLCGDEPSQTRTLIEVPADLDVFARRDPTWHGGAVHAGAKHGTPADDAG